MSVFKYASILLSIFIVFYASSCLHIHNNRVALFTIAHMFAVKTEPYEEICIQTMKELHNSGNPFYVMVSVICQIIYIGCLLLVTFVLYTIIICIDLPMVLCASAIYELYKVDLFGIIKI